MHWPRIGCSGSAWEWRREKWPGLTPPESSSTRFWRLLGKTRRVHFVGIGGSGMNGIGELLANLGYEGRGSGLKSSDVGRRLGAGVRMASHEGRPAGNDREAG